MSYEFRGFVIPEYMEPGIKRYIEKGILPGDFLRAIICNDLRGAIDHGDDVNLVVLPAYIGYFYNHVPGSCWGSKENMKSWHELDSEARAELLTICDYRPIQEF